MNVHWSSVLHHHIILNSVISAVAFWSGFVDQHSLISRIGGHGITSGIYSHTIDR